MLQHDQHIIIIGAGPIGMYFAILLSKFIKKITILEKRNLPYIRSQIVVFNSLKITTNLRYELMRAGACIVDPPAFTLGLTCYDATSNDKPLIACPLNVLENTLLANVKRIPNITIIRDAKILSINEQSGIIIFKTSTAKETALEYNILIGADGKKSMLKEKFANHYREIFIINEKDKIYGAIYVFKIDSKKIQAIYPSVITNFKHKRARIFIHRSGIIYVGLAISEDEYTDLLVNNKQIHPAVYEYLKINDITPTDNELLCSHVFINKISYCSKCCFKVNDRLHFLIGDACLNAHFFTGAAVNAHFDACNELIKLLTTNYKMCHVKNYYINHLYPNTTNSLLFTLKFNSENSLKDKQTILELAKKLKIPQIIINALSVKELYYLTIN